MPEFGTGSGTRAGGVGKLLGPKISLRVAGDGEIKPVDGTAENSEFCPVVCAMAAGGSIAARISTSAGHSRPRTAAVAGVLSMTVLFSVQIEAISSRAPVCLLPN
jgi:hypothetical protein